MGIASILRSIKQCEKNQSKNDSVSRLFVISWTVVHQTSLSMGILQAEYGSGLAFLSPRDLPSPEIEPGSPKLSVDSLPSDPPGKPKRNQRLKQMEMKGSIVLRCPFSPV